MDMMYSPREARIEVIESFKGSGERLEALPPNGANCGFSFVPGEERVYFVFSGVVTLCGRAAPRTEMLQRLRKLKLAEAACEGIPQPARPPAVAAVEEADPSPYEPLHGFDPELALGVGYVRPVREEERDDWTRRLKLPVFTAPDGEVKIWLSPGSVGGDALVETGYETASFIVLQARPPARPTLLALSMLAATAGLAYAGADEGKALYQQKCKVCHSIAGDAGKMADKGGKLDGVGAKRDAEWLTKYIRDPKSVMPDAKMPKLKMTDQELADYVAYMLTLK